MRIDRERLDDANGALARLDDRSPDGAASFLGQTATIAAYPTVPGAFYGVFPLGIDGDESEGSPASYTSDPTAWVMAYNVGSAIPAAGTTVLVHGVGGRWVFRYDG